LTVDLRSLHLSSSSSSFIYVLFEKKSCMIHAPRPRSFHPTERQITYPVDKDKLHDRRLHRLIHSSLVQICDERTEPTFLPFAQN